MFFFFQWPYHWRWSWPPSRRISFLEDGAHRNRKNRKQRVLAHPITKADVSLWCVSTHKPEVAVCIFIVTIFLVISHAPAFAYRLINENVHNPEHSLFPFIFYLSSAYPHIMCSRRLSRGSRTKTRWTFPRRWPSMTMFLLVCAEDFSYLCRTYYFRFTFRS